MSGLMHLIVGSDLQKELQELLGDDYDKVAKKIDGHIKREVEARKENETPYGFHRAVVGTFRVSFNCFKAPRLDATPPFISAEPRP